jgi:hypothetical protein
VAPLGASDDTAAASHDLKLRAQLGAAGTYCIESPFDIARTVGGNDTHSQECMSVHARICSLAHTEF